MIYVRKAGVIGAGAMGAAIAAVLAYNNIPVVLKELNDDLVQKGLGRVKGIVDELVKFNEGRADKEIERIADEGVQLTEEQKTALRTKLKPKFTRARGDETLARVKGSTQYSDFADVDLVVEAAFEKYEVKRAVFEELDKVLPDHAILASNTSSLSITKLA